MTSDLDAARGVDLARAIARAHILVTTGAGGVGKTTTAAAIGLAGARMGRRTLVLTIDPARRLAQSMGLEGLDNTPRQVQLDDTPDGGELWAMMLDMQSTFDGLIERHASSPRNAQAIRDNRIYRTMSSSLSGTQEYMAMEKLHELHESGEWDLLVIDTPPTRSALDFLDAPNRMTDFLEGKLLKLLMKPGMMAGKGYLKAVGFGATAFMKVASKVTGMDLLNDLAEFFRAFDGMYDGFKSRAAAVLELLREPTSQFVVVASPQPPPLREAHFFLERLQQEGLHAAGLVVNRINRVQVDVPTARDLRTAAAKLDDGGADDSAVASGLHLLADTADLAARERRDVNAAMFGIPVRALVEVPLLRSDVHDLSTLEHIVAALVGTSDNAHNAT